jgi:hypothetical protein
MKVIDALAEPDGFYILTAIGELRFLDRHKQLHIDEALSWAFAGNNREFLRAYLKNPEADRRRLRFIRDVGRYDSRDRGGRAAPATCMDAGR